jgi:hypothetical protein
MVEIFYHHSKPAFNNNCFQNFTVALVQNVFFIGHPVPLSQHVWPKKSIFLPLQLSDEEEAKGQRP